MATIANDGMDNLFGTSATAITKLRIFVSNGGTLLLEFDPVTIGAASSSSVSITGTTETAVASGTPTFFSLTDISNQIMITGSVGTSGSDITLGAITSGNSYSISSMTVSAA